MTKLDARRDVDASSQFLEANHQLKQKFVKFDQLTQQLSESSRNKYFRLCAYIAQLWSLGTRMLCYRYCLFRSIEADKLREEVSSLKIALADANKKCSIIAASSVAVI